MIFEVEYASIRKALNTIQSVLTGTELYKPEYSHIELHVKDEEVYFSFKGKKDWQLEYQVNIIGAEPILDGSINISFNDLNSAIKTFKQSEKLLIELDHTELRIDDGFLEPEIIILDENTNIENGFSLSKPSNTIFIPRNEFVQRMDIARLNNKTTFLPSTSSIALILTSNQLRIRSFNLASLYESIIELPHNFPNQLLVLNKSGVSRIMRLLKAIKEKDVQISFGQNEIYMCSNDFVFRFSGEEDDGSRSIYRDLPIDEISKSTKSIYVKIKDFQKVTKVKRGAEPPFGIAVEINGDSLDLRTLSKKEVNNNIDTQYPFKLVQRVVNKWLNEATLEIGTKENYHPLIFKHQTPKTSDTFVIMSLEKVN